jgi:hypothetical protein
MLRLPRVQYRSQEWWDHFGNCHRRVLESPGPYTKLYLLRDGCPSTYPGMDAIDVGSYTPDVTGRQLSEDFEAAELERIRKWRDAMEAA